MTSSYIQKEILTSNKTNNSGYNRGSKRWLLCWAALLVDESLDVSSKEQMVIVLQHVDKKGSMIVIETVHFQDTSFVSKENKFWCTC